MNRILLCSVMVFALLFCGCNSAYAGAASMIEKRHARYTVPQSFSISKLSDVSTIDCANQAILINDIPIPINPNPTPFLSENYEKKYQFIFSISRGYGLNQYRSTKMRRSQESRVNLPSKMASGIWSSYSFQIQPNAKYQWGYSYHAKLDADLSSNYLLNEIGYLIPQKKGILEIGVGLGWGMTKRINGNNYADSFDTFQNIKYGRDTMLEEAYSFIPNAKHSFMPINGHVKFIYPVYKNIELTAFASYTRIPCYNDFYKTETVLVKETITPTITSYKRDELSMQRVTSISSYQIYTLGLSIRIKI